MEEERDWRADFKRAMVDSLVRLSGFVRERPDIYGWEDYDWYADKGDTRTRVAKRRERIARVGIDYAASSYSEADWYEFAGTFVEADHKYGVDIDLVLLDGARYRMRYSGTLSELITSVLAE